MENEVNSREKGGNRQIKDKIIADLDVVDDQVVGVQALVLGVALRVLEHVEQELGGLEGPATLAGAVDSGLGVAANSSHKPFKKDLSSMLVLGHEK